MFCLPLLDSLKRLHCFQNTPWCNKAPNSNADSINGEKKEQAAQAFHFAAIFDSCQSRRPNRESGKKSTFFCFDENGEKLKKLEKSLVLTFSR